MSLPVARLGVIFLVSPVTSPAQAPIVRLTTGRREACQDRGLRRLPRRFERRPVESGGDSHEFSRDRPEIAPSPELFGHNRNRSRTHAVFSHDFRSGAPHDERGRHFRSVSDGRSARRARGGVARTREGACLWGDNNAFNRSVLAVHQRACGDCSLHHRLADFRGAVAALADHRRAEQGEDGECHQRGAEPAQRDQP